MPYKSREVRLAKNRAYRAANADRLKEYDKARMRTYRQKARPYLREKQRVHVWRHNGIKDMTWDRFMAMLNEQGFACAICACRIDQSAHVDHDHLTGVVRALLCSRCNHGLGHFKENKAVLLLAIEYLRRHEGVEP